MTKTPAKRTVRNRHEKRVPRWPAQPPRGLRPKLTPDQVRDLGICHLQNLDAIATGQADEATLWQVAGAAFTWSKVADLLGAGVPEMIPQLQLVGALIERYGKTGRVLFTGIEYQLAKIGTIIMDELARTTDRHTAVLAAEWSERRIEQLELACRERAAHAAGPRDHSPAFLTPTQESATLHGQPAPVERSAWVQVTP